MRTIGLELKICLGVMAVSLGLAVGVSPQAGAAPARGTLFHCWAYADARADDDFDKDGELLIFEDDDKDFGAGYLVSVRGKIHRNGRVHNPVLVDVGGVLVASFSGQGSSAGRNSLRIEGIRRQRELSGHLILRYMGENSQSNLLYFSRETQSRHPRDAVVDTRDLKCHFIPEW